MFYFVEPHGDDALISCFTLLKSLDYSGRRSHLITLSERSSEGLAKRIPSLESEFMDLDDINYRYKPKIDTHEINRMYKKGDPVASYVRAKCMQDVPADVKSHAESQLSKWLIDLKPNLDKFGVFVVPLGLDHPYHIFVSDKLKSSLRHDNKIYYVEKPYLSKRYIRQVVEDQSRFFEDKYAHIIVEYTEELKTLKAILFKEVYPTEQSLLRFTRDSVLSDPDEFFVPFHLVNGVTDLLRRSGLSYKVKVGGKEYESNDSDQS